jgi:hypothetical protein
MFSEKIAIIDLFPKNISIRNGICNLQSGFIKKLQRERKSKTN